MRQLSQIDPNLSYNIIGFMKCGSTLLQEVMKDLGIDVIRHEWYVVSPKGLKTHEKLYSDRIPIIIMREPVARAWSHIHYFGRMNNPQYPSSPREFIYDRRVDPTYYDMNPISVSNYAKHIKNWMHLNPITMSMEALVKDYPHLQRINAQKYDDDGAAYMDEIRESLKREFNAN